MLVQDRHVWRLVIGTLVVLIIACCTFWSQLPAQDPSAYFNFADQRFFLGIPNFFDVISNLLFIYVGIWGILSAFALWMSRPKAQMMALFFVNLSVILTGWGSSYFHMTPNALTLFWDRAPMAMGFMAMLSLILADRAPSRLWQVLLLPFMGLGIYTTWLGSFGEPPDIRYYIALQFGSIIFALVLVLFRKAMFLNNKLMYATFFFYALAKIFEITDHAVFERALFSGHTLKHAFAALAIFTLNLAIQVPVRRR